MHREEVYFSITKITSSRMSKPSLTILRVNKAIHAETESFFYGNNVFELRIQHMHLQVPSTSLQRLPGRRLIKEMRLMKCTVRGLKSVGRLFLMDWMGWRRFGLRFTCLSRGRSWKDGYIH